MLMVSDIFEEGDARFLEILVDSCEEAGEDIWVLRYILRVRDGERRACTE